LINSRNETYAAFRLTPKPKLNKVWLDIFLGWLSLLSILFLAALVFSMYSNWLIVTVTIIFASMICGYCVAYLVNFFHEAAHFNIAGNKKNNDLLANIFIGILIGQSIKNYRLVHWEHHKNLGTPQDTETSYFETLNPKFILESFTGIRVLKVLSGRNDFIKKISTELQKENLKQFFCSIFFHILVITCFVILNQWWLIAVWVLGIAAFYPFFNSLRQLLEHRADWADRFTNYKQQPHGKLTRIFGNSFFERSFGSAGFNKHLLHHLEPQISYTRLKDLERFLKDTQIGSLLQSHTTSYTKTFINLFQRK
jgi:fatty acid desaturase